MPIITDIAQQLKRKSYYNIFIDGKFTLSLSELDLATTAIKRGQVITAEELDRLKALSTNSKCYNCALRYLAIRPRSIGEVRQYLTVRKGYSEGAAQQAIDKLNGEGYLDDLDFARLWIRNRMLLSPKSDRALWAELAKKGINKDDIETALSELSEDDQISSIIDIISKKSKLPKYSDQRKMIEFLSRRGYKYDLIKKALEASDAY